MKLTGALAFTVLLSGAISSPSAAQAGSSFVSDAPTLCGFNCDEWNRDAAPFRVFGNTYYVGTAGLSSVLITSEQGHILIDGGLAQSAALIDAHIRALGFRTADVRLILNSHAHYDHAAGIAALQRASSAGVAAGAAGSLALLRGGPGDDDPQARSLKFSPVRSVRGVADGETLRVGELTITARLTPGHTPGSAAWFWRSCADGQCHDMVYADSLTSVSDPGFRFSGGNGQPSRVESFRKSIDTVASLPCEILLTPHPEASDLFGKLRRREVQPVPNPFVNRDSCREYAARARTALDRRVAEEGSVP